MCDCGMERLPPGVRACSACEVASRWADRYAALLAERDLAVARAEQAERERDEARRMFDVTRHRILHHLGVSDLGIGWFHVGAEVARLRAERDEALARCETLRGLADQSASDLGLMARRMGQAQLARNVARAALRRAEARAAVVVWGLAVADWRVWRIGERWVFHVPFGAPEADPVLTCPATTDNPLADVTDAIVDAIAATHGCPDGVREGWEGVRGC